MDSAIMHNEPLKDNQDNMSESVHSNRNEISEGNGNENSRGDRNYNGGGNQNGGNINVRNENRDGNQSGGENINNGNGNGKNEDDGGDGGGNENVNATNGPFITVRSVAMAKSEECFQDFEINTELKAKINNNILEFIINLVHCGVGDMLNKNDWSLQNFVGFYLDSLIIEVSPLPDNKEGKLDLFTLTNKYNPLPPKQENREVSKGYETNAGLQASFFPPGFSANCSVTNSHKRMATRDEWKMRMPSSAKTGVKWIYEFQGTDVNRGCPDLQLHSGHWYPNEAMTGFRIIIKQILRCRLKFRYVKLPEIFRQCPQITHTLEVSFNNITNFNESFNELKVRHTEQQEIYVNFNGSDISKAAKSEIQTEDVPNQKEFISLNRIVSREPYTKQS
ncbi:Sel1 repeat-containing protein [Gigaspora margarita]|nr:Sel1 repeat-containing protein [Gigaspora margarita]